MPIRNILRYAVIVGIFAVLFVPFFIANPLFFPFITGKNFAFRIVVEIVAALWVVLALMDPTVRPKKSLLLYAVTGLITALALSDILGVNPAKSLWSNFERMEGWISFAHFGLYFLVTSSMLQGEKLWRAFWNMQIGASVLMAGYGILQLAGVSVINQGGVRVDGTFGNATYLAIYMLISFFLTALALAAWKPGRIAQVFYAIALVLEALMIFYSATRGTILGALGGLFLAGLIFIIGAKGEKKLRLWGAVLAATVVIAIGGFYLVRNTALVQNNDVLTRIASISIQQGQTRFDIWRMALKGIAERPILGWGQENFNYVFNKYYEPSMYGQEPWFDRAHNEFLDMTIAGGVVSLAFYLALFGLALWYLWRGSTFSLAERALMTGLIAGYVFHNLFVFDNLVSYILFFSVLAYLASRRTASAQPIGVSTVLPPATAWAGSVTAALALAAAVWFLNVPGITRANDLIQGIQQHGPDLTQNFTYFKAATTGGGIGRQEAHEQLLQFAVQAQDPALASLSTPQLRSDILAYTRDEFGKEVAREPDDARLRVFYGSFLRQIGDVADAGTELAKALALSPAKQSIFFELGALAAQENDAPQTLSWFKQAYDLDPAYDQARFYYAASLIRAKQADRAKQILVAQFGTATPDNAFILQAYFDVQDYTSVIAIAEGHATTHASDYNAFVQLGVAYLRAGRRADAVTALQKAVDLNSAFKQQGEYYISEIKAGRNP
jgi:O-antigen ligase/tetratricopeptide (TPR) repeat protein